jgi:ElaA protein
MIKHSIKTFEQLNTRELYQLIQLREKVFIVEQECYYLDADGKDDDSWHLMLHQDDELIAYLRILPPGISYQTPSIGRVVVDEKHRKKGYGIDIMKIAMDFLDEKYDMDITISAQMYLNKFYSNLGFENVGEEYLEDGIPHIKMIRVSQSLI